MSGCSNSVVTTAYLFFHLPLLCCLRLPSSVWPTRQRGRSLGAGGTSRGGSSLSRDDLRDRLSNLGRVFFKDLHLAMLDNRSCSLDNPQELRRLFPGAFLAENDLMRVVPGRGHWVGILMSGLKNAFSVYRNDFYDHGMLKISQERKRPVTLLVRF